MSVHTFDRWVSLGSFCLPKYQINRYIARHYFGLEQNSTNLAANLIKSLPREKVVSVNGGNTFFDWTVVRDYDAATKLIAAGMEYSLSEDDLYEHIGKDGNIESIGCRQAGILWHHLFSRENGLRDWRDQIPSLRPKVDRFINNFQNLSKHSTLYVIAASIRMFQTGATQKLYEALEKGRATNTPFSVLLCVPEPITVEGTENIFVRHFDDTPDISAYGWLGNAESWDLVFSDFRLSASIT
jgi:hypothetical protein